MSTLLAAFAPDTPGAKVQATLDTLNDEPNAGDIFHALTSVGSGLAFQLAFSKAQLPAATPSVIVKARFLKHSLSRHLQTVLVLGPYLDYTVDGDRSGLFPPDVLSIESDDLTDCPGLAAPLRKLAKLEFASLTLAELALLAEAAYCARHSLDMIPPSSPLYLRGGLCGLAAALAGPLAAVGVDPTSLGGFLARIDEYRLISGGSAPTVDDQANRVLTTWLVDLDERQRAAYLNPSLVGRVSVCASTDSSAFRLEELIRQAHTSAAARRAERSDPTKPRGRVFDGATGGGGNFMLPPPTGAPPPPTPGLPSPPASQLSASTASAAKAAKAAAAASNAAPSPSAAAAKIAAAVARAAAAGNQSKVLITAAALAVGDRSHHFSETATSYALGGVVFNRAILDATLKSLHCDPAKVNIAALICGPTSSSAGGFDVDYCASWAAPAAAASRAFVLPCPNWYADKLCMHNGALDRQLSTPKLPRFFR